MPKNKKKNLSNATIFDEGGYHVQGHLAVADACRTPDCTGFLPFSLKKTFLITVCSFSLYQSMVIILVEGCGSREQSLMSLPLLFLSSLSNISTLYAFLAGDCGGPMAFSVSSARDPIFYRWKLTKIIKAGLVPQD